MAEETSEHYKKAQQHAQARAAKAPKAKRASKTRRRVKELPLETYPATELTAKERQQVAKERQLTAQADTQAALDRHSELTPLQLKRLANSEAKKAALIAKRQAKGTPPTN